MTAVDDPRRLTDVMSSPAELSRLRAEQPVCPVRLPNGDRAHLVTRYEDVAAVLADPRFSRLFDPGGGRSRAGDRATPPGEVGTITRTLGMDGEAHRTLRAVVGRAFTARRVERMAPAVQEITDGLLAGMRSHGSPADLVSHLASPLPITVICRLLG